MMEAETQAIAQYLALAVYICISVFGVVIAWNKRDTMTSINKAKESATEWSIFEDRSLDGMPASFSRTVGLAGAIILGGFIWCIGLFILVGHPMLDRPNIAKTINDFTLAASALFAPYAFNQLSKIFSFGSTASRSEGTAAVSAKADGDLKSPIPPPP